MRDIFFKKAAGMVLVGLLCLIFGTVYGAVSHDRTLILLSVTVFGVCIYKAYDIHKILKNKRFKVIEGECKTILFNPIGKYRRIQITFGEQTQELSVPKNIKVKQGKKYRFYFKDNNGFDLENKYIKNKILSDSLIGYEEI